MISHILCLCTRYGGGAVGGVLRCLTYSVSVPGMVEVLWEGSYDVSHTLTVPLPGMVEVLWARPHYKTLLSALLLAKCLRAKLWEGSYDISYTQIISLYQVWWRCCGPGLTIRLSCRPYSSPSVCGPSCGRGPATCLDNSPA